MKQKLALVFLHYLRILAKIQLGKINLVRKLQGKKEIDIVGITGSMGKTSTMVATMAALKDNFTVKYSSKANSETGIPLDILGLSMENYSYFDWLRVAVLSLVKLFINWCNYDVYLVEMGVDEPNEPKNMSYLLKIVRPKIGVFTGASSVHSMQFERVISKNLPPAKKFKAVMKAIADEKGKMITGLPETGFAILNFDDPLVRSKKNFTKAEVISVGSRGETTVKVLKAKVGLGGTAFEYQIKDQKLKLFLENLVLPYAYADNFGLAIGVAIALGLTPEKAILGIKKRFKLPCGRSSLIKGVKKTLMIDSSYNASPKAMLVMLDLLNHLGKSGSRKKVAVLGDMRELGHQSRREHQLAAKRAAVVADEIVLVGSQMKDYFLPEAIKSGFKEEKIHHFANAWQAAEFLKEELSGGELILVKGSQNTIFLEIVVEALMEDQSKSGELLCRRGKFWDQKRGGLKKYF